MRHDLETVQLSGLGLRVQGHGSFPNPQQPTCQLQKVLGRQGICPKHASADCISQHPTQQF